MSDGRTVWRAKDALWHDREWIAVLVEEFGPAGYAVADYLESAAKIQNDGGYVKTGPRVVSRATGADVVTVGHVVSRAVTLGLLDEYEDLDGRFTCRVTWFAADQGKAMAASRKARQRSNGPIEPDDPPPLSRSVTPSHDVSPNVPLTGQDRTGQRNVNSNAELRSAILECFAYWQERCDHPQAQLDAKRRGAGERCLRDRRRHHGGDLSKAIADVRLAVEGAAIAPFIDAKGKRFDDFELICRNAAKLEDFMGRAGSGGTGTVLHFGRRAEVIQAANAWQNAPEYRGNGA